YRKTSAASGRQASRYACPSHGTCAPALTVRIASALPYAHLLVVRIRGVDLARQKRADGDLFRGERDEIVALEQDHRLRRHGVLGHAELRGGGDEIGENAVDVLDRGLERILQRGALLEIVGGVDREQL